MGRLEGKVAVITGGSRGQGESEAWMFAREGAAVAICDVLDEPGRAVAQQISDEGLEARYFHLDVTDPANWADTVAGIIAWKGRLTTLVNNAGIVNRTGVMETSLKAWNRVLAVNLNGALLGLLGLTRSAAMELVGWGIRVNAVCPGIIVTGLNAGGAHLEPWRRATPLGRYGTIEEAARAVLFLASDESSFITGEDLAVDGGFKAGGAARRISLEAGINLPA